MLRQRLDDSQSQFQNRQQNQTIHPGMDARSPLSQPRLSFKKVAVSMISCAVLLALLNLYMNAVTSYTVPSFQLDLSPDGDVVGFHQFDLPNEKLPRSPTAVKRQMGNYRLDRGEDTKQSPGSLALFCPGLCPPAKSGQAQADYVSKLLRNRLKAQPGNVQTMQELDNEEGRFADELESRSRQLDETFFQSLWHTTSAWVGPRRITPLNLDAETFKRVVLALNKAPLQRASVPTKGTQLKAQLTLRRDQKVLWKPQRYGRNATVPGDTPYSGADRHNGEIAAFHLGRLMLLNRIPIAVGRRIRLRRELHEVADDDLAATFFDNSVGTMCFFGKCMYCKKTEPVCDDADGSLEGTTILWLPAPYDQLDRLRSPWARTYDPTRLAQWETDSTYCSRVRAHETFGRAPLPLDLIDMAIFDFLIGNADRHRLEFFKDVQPPMVLLLDNGKSFGDPNQDELTILAPLYQCCRVRTKLYSTLVRYAELNLGRLLDEQLKLDPLYPILTARHLEAVNRRLRKLLLIVAMCLDEHGADYVLKDDGF